MRFALAMWVLLAHSYNFRTAGSPLPIPSENALVAVYGFLAISGFSIHHSIYAHHEGFWGRRFWRIAPTHFVSILLAILVYMVCGQDIKDGHGNSPIMPSMGTWIACVLLLQAVVPRFMDVLFPSWTLSVEIICYFAAPLLRGRNIFISIGLLIMSCCFCFLRPKISSQYVGLDSYGISVLSMFWAWIAGWIAYELAGKWLFCILIIGVGTGCIFTDSQLSGWMNYAVWALVVGFQFWGDRVRLNNHIASIAEYLGELSFPLYLIQYPVFFLLLNFVFAKVPTFNTALNEIIAVLLSSVVIYHIFDLPFRRRLRLR
jgi:peptidoglycan/LPS O-acetylase OafA/YrhL